MRERFEKQVAIIVRKGRQLTRRPTCPPPPGKEVTADELPCQETQVSVAKPVETPPAHPVPVEANPDAGPETTGVDEGALQADAARKQARRAWEAMVDRCFNAAQAATVPLDTYVCSEWQKDFESFLRDMGEPEGNGNAYLRRPDADRPYMPGNCVWTYRNSNKARQKGESDPSAGVWGRGIHRAGKLPSDDRPLMSRDGSVFDGMIFASDAQAHRAFQMKLRNRFGALHAVCAHVGASDSVILQRTDSGEHVLTRTWFEEGKERARVVVTANEQTAHDWYVGLISLHWNVARRMMGRRGA